MEEAAILESQAWCEKLTRAHAGNFYHAFRLLPREQRRAMCVLYAFMRITDDLTDGPESPSEKATALAAWRGALDRALTGTCQHPLHPALGDMVERYGIPRDYLDAVLDGVAMDLEPCVYTRFDELYRYCYHVASVVGLACLHIWGFTDERAKELAEKAGIAFQLTNILRDLREDAERGRIYLPREDLDRFGYTALMLYRGERNENFRALMRFQARRAHEYYEAALPLAAYLRPPGRAVFLVMLRTYRGLLETIEKRDYDVFSGRVSLSRWHKLGLVLQALPIRWGWIR